MKRLMPLQKQKRNRQSGSTLMDFVIAFFIIVIAFVSWTVLTSQAIRNGNHVRNLPETHRMAESKAAEITAIVQTLTFPTGVNVLGSIAPVEPVNGYFDYLSYDGQPLTPGSSGAAVYTRQWQIIRDYPLPGDITVEVSIKHLGLGGKFMRLSRIVDPDTARPATTAAGSGRRTL